MRQTILSTTALMVGLAVAGCGAPEQPPAEVAEPEAPPAAEVIDPAAIADAGTVTGTVEFTGTAPEAALIQMSADPYCVTQHQGQAVRAQRVVVNDNGTLRWAFVYVKEGLEGKSFTVPAEPALLDQQACLYEPHVFGVQTGQTLRILNSDDTLHNINVQPTNNAAFNIGQPIKGMSHEQRFSNPEVMIPVKCDVHPWMSAFIGVLPHPYFAVTDEAGGFTLERLPPGEYVIEAWHEVLGTRTQTVSVGPAETVEVSFAFGS